MNSQYFSKEQVANGEMQKLLDFLMSEAYGSGDHYNDIHIYPSDMGAFVIEWEQTPWSHDYGGKFEYIDEEHVVMLEKRFPDGSYELFHDEEEFNEQFNEWLKENPGWVKTDYDTWTNLRERCFTKSEIDDECNGNSILSGLEENGIPQ